MRQIKGAQNNLSESATKGEIKAKRGRKGFKYTRDDWGGKGRKQPCSEQEALDDWDLRTTGGCGAVS